MLSINHFRIRNAAPEEVQVQPQSGSSDRLLLIHSQRNAWRLIVFHKHNKCWVCLKRGARETHTYTEQRSRTATNRLGDQTP